MEVSIGQRAARLYADVQAFAPKRGSSFAESAGPRPAAVATFFRRCAAHLGEGLANRRRALRTFCRANTPGVSPIRVFAAGIVLCRNSRIIQSLSSHRR